MTSPAPDFNPYHAWLGLDRSVTQPNYFQLLGISPQEQDAARISAAAQQATTRVRGFRPGSRSAQWARLLDEINVARTCLADPVKRADYERQLATPGGATTRGFSRPAPRGSRPAAGVPAGTSATQPRAVPMSAPQPHGGPQSVGEPTGAAGYGQVPTGIPVGSSGVSGSPNVAATGGIVSTPQKKPISVAASRKSNRSIMTPVVISAAACVILLVAILLLVVAMKEPSTKKKQPTTPRVAQTRTTQDRMRRSNQPPRRPPAATHQTPDRDSFRPAVGESPRKSRTEAEHRVESEVLSPPADTDEESWSMPAFSKLNPGLSPEGDTPVDAPSGLEPVVPVTPQPPIGPDSADPANPPADPPVTPDAGAPSVPVMPESGTPPATGPNIQPAPTVPRSTPAPAFQPKAEDVAALAATLRSARAAVTNGEFDSAIDQLAKLESLPKTSEHQAMYDRLSLLAQYAKNFQSALGEAVAALQSGDEIEVGTSVVVGVVDVSADRITVRAQGANQTRAIADLPPGLAVAIADRWFRKDDPAALVMKAAYLVARKAPKATELDKARQWWQEAASKGLDIGDLQKVIDDTYDLKAAPGQ